MQKTAQGLCTHAKAQLGLPYIYGTFGRPLTNDIIRQKRAQYPSLFSEAQAKTAAEKHLGKRSYDCAGLIKSYWFQDTPESYANYIAGYDKSAAGLKACCKTTGSLKELPEEPGLLLFYKTTHVGVYIGGGKAVEARDYPYGVVETKVKDRPWDAWGRLDWLAKEEDKKEEKKEGTYCAYCGHLIN